MRATFGVVTVHKRPVELDFGAMLTSQLKLVFSMDYPTDIFEAIDEIIANWEKHALIISDRIPFADSLEALKLAATPGAADKFMVIFQ